MAEEISDVLKVDFDIVTALLMSTEDAITVDLLNEINILSESPQDLYLISICPKCSTTIYYKNKIILDEAFNLIPILNFHAKRT